MITRRALLRGAAAIAAASAALRGRQSVVAGQTSSAVRDIRLAERGGAVWAWAITVAGRARLPGRVEVTAEDEPLDVERDGRRFTAVAPLGPGVSTITASVVGGEDTATATYEVPLVPRPVAVAVAKVVDDALVLDGSASAPSPVSGAAVVGYRWTQRFGTDLDLPADGALVERPRPLGEGPWYVDLTITDADGLVERAGICLIATPKGPRPLGRDERAPWVASAVVYGVIPFAFGYSGFDDVTAALDRMVDLKITTLWMSPVFKTMRFEFGYGVTDYFTIRNDYGAEPALRRLIDAAHVRGLRVLLDVAANHTSIEHPYVRDAQRHGTRSHQWDYHERDEQGDLTYYFDWEDLPNLDFDNPEVRRWITEVLLHWVRELDIDGYRFDAAWGVQERRPAYWRGLVRDLRRIKPDLLLLAEASTRDPVYVEHGFDLAYDWTDELGHWAWRDVFTDVDHLVARLDQAITAAPGDRVFRFLNNNDTGERFLDRHGLGLTRAATALLLTLPGVPCVYCGDEVGATLDPYETYGPIDWTTHPELRAWHRLLLGVRADRSGLRTADFQRLPAEPARAIYAYARGGDMVVVINFSPDTVIAEIDRPEVIMSDALTGEVVPAGPVELAGWGARVLTPIVR